MQRLLEIVAWNLFFFVALMLGLEVLCQVGFMIKYGQSLAQATNLPHRIAFEPHPYLAGRLRSNIEAGSGAIKLSTTAQGRRRTGSEGASPGAYRVAVLGGSTTFGAGVSDEDTWPAQLQAQLGEDYAVTNLALPGYSTAEHVVQMALEVPELAPNLVVFYVGINDLRNYHNPALGADYYGHGMQQYGNLGIPRPGGRDRLRALGDWSALVQFTNKYGARLWGGKPLGPPPSAAPDAFVDRIYRRNLETLWLLADHLDAAVLFIPQVLNHQAYRSTPGAEAWSPTVLNQAMPELMTRFNGFVEAACPKAAATCEVAHQAPALGWVPADFVDTMHFSPQGNTRFTEMLAPLIRARRAQQ